MVEDIAHTPYLNRSTPEIRVQSQRMHVALERAPWPSHKGKRRSESGSVRWDILLISIENDSHRSKHRENGMKCLWRRMGSFWRDRRPLSEQAREKAFILAVNKLQTLRVTAEGGMSIDPEEIREQVIASRHALKHFVRKP